MGLNAGRGGGRGGNMISSTDDTVGIVVYAGSAGTVLEPTKVAEKTTIPTVSSGDEIKGLLRGEPVIRLKSSDDEEDTRPRSSVPTGGGIGELPQGA